MLVESWSQFLQISALGLTVGLTVGFLCLAVRYSTAKLEQSFRVATQIR